MSLKEIGFIGAGNIAEAIMRGIITSGKCDPGDILISDNNMSRLEFVNKTLGASIAKDNFALVKSVKVLFVAVKPHQLLDVLSDIKNSLSEETFVVSVVAGKNMSGIREALGGHRKVCRIMPNLSASVRKSVISLFADEDTSKDELLDVFTILSATGKVFQIKNEKDMATLTALSGSAPAYYAMMASALVKYGVSQGLDHDLAVNMILSTMEGSAAWALNSKISLDDLWRKVVTPGGTTEAGVNYYNEKQFLDIFIEGLNRATERAREMGDR